MLKKITSVLGTITLICFSFYYTDSAVDIIRKSDPIMKEIVEYSNLYGNTSVDPILVNNNIIPGIKGTAVDIEESYHNMKRLGKFDKSLIVFQEVNPVNSITNNYDNYIISGNMDKNAVSLVFVLKDTSYVEEILKTLNKKNIQATFFFSKDLFDSSLNLMKIMLTSGHDVELLDTAYDVSAIKKNRTIKNTISDKSLKYCYTVTKEKHILENCKKEQLHTIIPSIVTTNYPYNDVKNELKNGAIISLTNQKNTERELSSIINYILQKGKKIVPLEKLLEE